MRIMKSLPEVVNAWKLGAAREIIFSGFQQDLYTPYERPFAYWLLSHIMDMHIHSLEVLCSFGGLGMGAFGVHYLIEANSIG